MIYLVDGDTYTGKTTFLKNYMKANPRKLSKYMTDEEWVDLLIKVVEHTRNDEECIKQYTESFSYFDILCIDNVDFLRGKEIIQTITAEIIAGINDTTQVFLSGIDLEKNLEPMLRYFRRNEIEVHYADYNCKI